MHKVRLLMRIRIPESASGLGTFLKYAVVILVDTRRSGITHDETIRKKTRFGIFDVQK
jgi:hypothetical protein